MRSAFHLILLLARQGFDPAQILFRLILRKHLKDCDTVLDVGCGKFMNLRWLGVNNTVGIDGYEPDLNEALRRGTHDKLVLGNVCNLDEHFKPNQFDAVIALDVIEHLTKDDGSRMLQSMERIARRKIIIFTPNGFLPQHHLERSDLQEHLSGWEVSEMQSQGYHVFGLLGPKSLRGEFHVLKGRPKSFFGLVSLTGHFLWTRWFPSRAAAIFCIKTKLGT
jgi:2-polyprenyl-3-methyl-5-hydroxy-6-metoxy-1,4-benzoquinol methylase